MSPERTPMYSTMQEVPLLVSGITECGRTVNGAGTVVTWTGDAEPRERTYAEVGDRAARLAHALHGELGVRRGERVATLMWNNAEHLEAYLAVPSMGAVLHTLNLRLPPEQLAWVVNHAEDRVVLVNGSLLALLADLLPLLRSVAHVVVVGPGDRGVLAGAGPAVHDYEELLAGRPVGYDWPELDEGAPAAMCYTSGTTGDPKGVVYSHRSVYLHCLQVNAAAAFGMARGDRMLPVVPMFHANAWGLPHAAFMNGTDLLMPDRFLQPAALAAMIARARPSHAAGVPTIWQGLLAELRRTPHDVRSLRHVTVGGSACPPDLVRSFHDQLGILPSVAWGMTETSPLGTFHHLARVPAAGGADGPDTQVKQGYFPAPVQARLVGPGGAVLPRDGVSAGELEVRGPWVTGAYYGGPGAGPLRSGDRFSADGWLRTGDVGVIDADGCFVLTDRVKDVIKSGGEWISSVALENALMSHPDVVEAAVVAVPDARWDERPLAAVVLAEGAVAGPAELYAFLAARVPRWQVPDHWAFLPEVPKTSVGKFDKRRLRADHAAGSLAAETFPQHSAR